MDVCVHGGLHCRRMAGASKWTKSGLSGPSSSSCLLFRGPKNGAKNRPQKRGRNIAGRRQGFQNGGPVSGTRVLHTPSAPLCVQWVTETPEPFVCFSWQRAWQSLIQVLQYIIIYIYYIYIYLVNNLELSEKVHTLYCILRLYNPCHPLVTNLIFAFSITIIWMIHGCDTQTAGTNFLRLHPKTNMVRVRMGNDRFYHLIRSHIYHIMLWRNPEIFGEPVPYHLSSPGRCQCISQVSVPHPKVLYVLFGAPGESRWMGLSTGRPWQAKHREIGIDLTAKKRMESRKPAVSGSWRGRIFSWTLTFETMTKPFKLPRQGKSPFYVSWYLISMW